MELLVIACIWLGTFYLGGADFLFAVRAVRHWALGKTWYLEVYDSLLTGVC